MERFNKVLLKDMTIPEILEFILKNPEACNPHRSHREHYRDARSTHITIAIDEALSVLPEGRSKRALKYVADHPAAEFHFGGSDAVGPAIREALDILRNKKAA